MEFFPNICPRCQSQHTEVAAAEIRYCYSCRSYYDPNKEKRVSPYDKENSMRKTAVLFALAICLMLASETKSDAFFRFRVAPLAVGVTPLVAPVVAVGGGGAGVNVGFNFRGGGGVRGGFRGGRGGFAFRGGRGGRGR